MAGDSTTPNIPRDDLEQLGKAFAEETGHEVSDEQITQIAQIIQSLSKTTPSSETDQGHDSIAALAGNLLPTPRVRGTENHDYHMITQADFEFLQNCDNQNLSTAAQLLLGGAIGSLVGAVGAVGWFSDLAAGTVTATGESLSLNIVTIVVFVCCLSGGVMMTFFDKGNNNTLKQKLTEIENRGIRGENTSSD